MADFRPVPVAAPADFDATVGATGADHLTVSAAVAAGDTRLLMISNTTETAGTSVGAAGLFVHIQGGVTWSVPNQSFKVTTTADCNIMVTGEGFDSRLTYAFTGNDNEVFDGTGDTVFLTMKDLEIENLSLSGVGQLVWVLCEPKVSNVRMIPSNFRDCGFGDCQSVEGYIVDCVLVGVGTGCSGGIVLNEGRAHNITVIGSWSTTLGAISANSNNVIFTNIYFNHTGTAVFNAGGYCSNIRNRFTGTLNVVQILSDSIVDGVFATAFDPRAQDRNRYTNINVTIMDLTDTGMRNNEFVNCRVTNAVTLAGDRNDYTNHTFLGGASVSSGADDNGFGGCQFGADNGGGALTLTIDSGSNRTRVVRCRTDAALVDNGTGTAVAANTVY